MKWLGFLFSVVFFAALVGTPAEAWFKHGAASASCPQATDNGCAAAQANGSFLSASLLTSAQQSGQNSLLPTRAGGLLTLNIPAVDYGIGPASTLTPQDPRTINDSICHYTNAPPEIVLCYGSGVLTETLNNYDFSGAKIGKGPVLLYLDKTPQAPSAGSTITITNSYFALQGGGAGLDYCVGYTGNWNIVFKNNQCDGSSAISTSDFPFRDDGDLAGTSLDIEYTAFTHVGVGRIIGGMRYTALTFKYNFVQGLNDLLTSNHGEVALRSCSQTGCTGSEDYEGNFVIWNTTVAGSVNNATFFPSDGASDGIVLSFFTVKDNIIVTNTCGSPATPAGCTQIGKALFNTRLASLGIVTITGNWMDGTGANFCGISGTAQNGDGTASTSGNTINITALDSSFNNFPIEPNYFAINPGFTTASITAYGTGTGKTGTYTFGGSPQAQGSTSTWTFVPGYTGTPTLTPNWNLADPSHTGSPQAVGFTGPTMADTNCQGAH